MEIKSFSDWAKDHGFDIGDPDAVGGSPDKAMAAKAENRIRTGYSGNYPPAYASAQYPHAYFVPRKATADLDKEQGAKPGK